MAEKDTQMLDSSQGTSGKSRAKPVKVVHIGNPRMVNASQSEFRAVVQALTGKKRPSAATSKGINSCGESPQVKLLELEGQLKCCPDPKSSTPVRPASTHLEMPAISTDAVSTSEIQHKETMSDVYAHQMYDALENLGDAILYFRFFPHLHYDDRIN